MMLLTLCAAASLAAGPTLCEPEPNSEEVLDLISAAAEFSASTARDGWMAEVSSGEGFTMSGSVWITAPLSAEAAEEDDNLADFDGSGAVDTTDLFGYVRSYFAGEPEADVNGDGVVRASDVYAFITLWLKARR